jgi:hypothetical protein
LTDDMWDPWPDGDFERLFTWEEVNGTNNLSEHWACQPGGGDKRGSESALTWQHGKRTRRVCLGVITCDAEAYPVIDYILRSKKKVDGVGAYSIPFCGDISSHEYAKIARWFSENVPGAASQVEKWLGGMPLVHAFTLVVAHRKAGDFKKRVQARNEEWNDSDLLKMAWADLMLSCPANSFVADVDLECLVALEARMFEDSEEAGPAGNQ